jgi:arylsulfatase
VLKKWLFQAIPIAAVALLAWGAQPAHAQSSKPNILLIMSDDVGIANLSAYSMGLVGYKTPNIDRIAKEGMMFTDFITGNKAALQVVLLSSPASIRLGRV